MIQEALSRLIVIALCSAFVLAACGKSEEEASVAALAADSSLLKYVPADSPYIFANVEPMPEAVLDKLEPRLDRVLRAYDALLRQAVSSALTEAGDAAGASADAEKFAAVAAELSALMSVEGLRGAGIDRESTAVLYGNGLLPVLRMSVSDSGLFEAALDRIEDKAEQEMSVQAIGDHSFRYIAADQVKLILAPQDDQVVVTMAPTSFDDEGISQLLGLTPPARSIADARTLRTLAETYGYTPQLVGFVDMQALVERLIGEPSGLDAKLFASTGMKARPQLSAVCKTEIREVATIAPRIVFGYTDITTEQMQSHALLELRDDIGKGLAALPVAVPGLNRDPGGLFSFGMSLDVMAARKFYEARLDALEADPYTCESFAQMQAGVAAGRQALQQPVPPMIYDFRGFLAVINDLEGLDLASGAPPTSIDGRFLLAMKNAPSLLALGAMFSPELAGLSLEPDGEPVPFRSQQLAGIVDSVYVAMTDDAIALSFGAGMQDGLEGMMAADADANGTTLTFSMDASRYYAFIGEAIMLAEEDSDAPMPPEMQAVMNEVMLSFSELYERMRLAVRLTDRGIELDTTITLKD